jgi:hypothetical protein
MAVPAVAERLRHSRLPVLRANLVVRRLAQEIARVGPTTPKRARRLYDASVDPTDARNALALLTAWWSRT